MTRKPRVINVRKRISKVTKCRNSLKTGTQPNPQPRFHSKHFSAFLHGKGPNLQATFAKTNTATAVAKQVPSRTLHHSSDSTSAKTHTTKNSGAWLGKRKTPKRPTSTRNPVQHQPTPHGRGRSVKAIEVDKKNCNKAKQSKSTLQTEEITTPAAKELSVGQQLKKAQSVHNEIAAIKERAERVRLLEFNRSTHKCIRRESERHDPLQSVVESARKRQQDWVAKVFADSTDGILPTEQVPAGLRRNPTNQEAVIGKKSVSIQESHSVTNTIQSLDSDDDDFGFGSMEGYVSKREDDDGYFSGSGAWIQSTREIINIPRSKSRLKSAIQATIKQNLIMNKAKQSTVRRPTKLKKWKGVKKKTKPSITSIAAQEYQYLKNANVKTRAAVLKLRTLAMKTATNTNKASGIITMGSQLPPTVPKMTNSNSLLSKKQGIPKRTSKEKNTSVTHSRDERALEEQQKAQASVNERQELAIAKLEKLVAAARAQYPILQQTYTDKSRKTSQYRRMAKELSRRHCKAISDLEQLRKCRKVATKELESAQEKGACLARKAECWSRLHERTLQQVLLLRARKVATSESIRVHQEHEEEVVDHYRTVVLDRERTVMMANQAMLDLEHADHERDVILHQQQHVLTHSHALMHYFEAHEKHRDEIRQNVRSKVPSSVIKLQKTLDRQNIASIATILKGGTAEDESIVHTIGAHEYHETEIWQLLANVREKCGLLISSPDELVLVCDLLSRDKIQLETQHRGIETTLLNLSTMESGLKDQVKEIEMEFGSYEYVARRGAFDEYQKQVLEKKDKFRELQRKVRVRSEKLLRIQCAINLFCGSIEANGVALRILNSRPKHCARVGDTTDSHPTLSQLQSGAVKTVQQLALIGLNLSDTEKMSSSTLSQSGSMFDNSGDRKQHSNEISSPDSVSSIAQTQGTPVGQQRRGSRGKCGELHESTAQTLLENENVQKEGALAIELLKRINDPDDQRHAFDTAEDLQFFQNKLEFLGKFSEALLLHVNSIDSLGTPTQAQPTPRLKRHSTMSLKGRSVSRSSIYSGCGDSEHGEGSINKKHSKVKRLSTIQNLLDPGQQGGSSAVPGLTRRPTEVGKRCGSMEGLTAIVGSNRFRAAVATLPTSKVMEAMETFDTSRMGHVTPRNIRVVPRDNADSPVDGSVD